MSELLPSTQPRVELQLPNGGVIESIQTREAYSSVTSEAGSLAVSQVAELSPGSVVEKVLTPEAAILQRQGLDRIANSPEGIDGITIPEETCTPQEARIMTHRILEAMHSEGGVLEGEDSFGVMQFVTPKAREHNAEYNWDLWNNGLPSLPEGVRDTPDRFDNDQWLRNGGSGDWSQAIDGNFPDHDNEDHWPILGTASGEFKNLASQAIQALYTSRVEHIAEWEARSEADGNLYEKPGELYAFNPKTGETSVIVSLDIGTADHPKGPINNAMNRIIQSDLEITRSLYSNNAPLRSAEEAAIAERESAQTALAEETSYHEMFENDIVGSMAEFATVLINTGRVKRGEPQIGEEFTDGSKRRVEPTTEELQQIKSMAREAVEGQIRVAEKIGIAVQSTRLAA